MALLNSPSSKSPIWTRDRVSSPSRSHFSPGLKLILRTQVTNPEHGRFQSLSKGVYDMYIYIYTYIHSSTLLVRTSSGMKDYYVLSEFTLHRDSYKFTNFVKK